MWSSKGSGREHAVAETMRCHHLRTWELSLLVNEITQREPGRAEEGAGATPAPLPLHPLGGARPPCAPPAGRNRADRGALPPGAGGDLWPAAWSWVTPRGSPELARLGVLRSQLQLRFLPPLLRAQLEGFLAGSCHCLLDPLPPRASFLLPSQLPANCIPLWVNHPGRACCPAGPSSCLEHRAALRTSRRL